MKAVQKIKAGALQFVLFISTIIAILLMAFILLSHTHKHFDKKTDFVISAIKAVSFGLESSLQKPIELEGSIAIPNENELPITITVKREFWGVFEKRTALAKHKNTGHTKIALVGGRQQKELPALYVSDKNRPVIIAGNAQITGTAHLPEQGLKSGNIYGNSYNRPRLLYGWQKMSDSVLPKLNREIQYQIAQLTRTNFVPEGKIVYNLPKELKNSFQTETIIIRDKTVRLKNIRLAGNIIISATDKIVVEASAELKDVILLAPEIEIQNWVKGCFQAVASESILVGKKCELYYPSALVVNKKPKPGNVGEVLGTKLVFQTKPSIYLDSYTIIGGIIIALEKDKEPQYFPQVKIEDNAKVIGELYCTKNLELKGGVTGSVLTDAFIAMENGSIYQNHLYNGSINSTSLSKSYSGLFLRNNEGKKKVMKWLY